jgi:hypothetical protein
MVKQRVLGIGRLVVEDVETDTAELSALECGEEVVVRGDETSAGGVDEDQSWFRAGE